MKPAKYNTNLPYLSATAGCPKLAYKTILLKLTSFTVHKTERICVHPHGTPQPCHISFY
jgi:hypothetical protein